MDMKTNVKGSVLAYGLIIMSVVAVLLSSILTFVVSQIKNSFYERAKQQSFQIAESGIDFYQWYLAHQTDGRTTAQIEAFWDSGTAYGVDSPYERAYDDPGGGTTGHYRITVVPPIAGSTIVTVTSVGWTDQYPENTKTIAVRFRRPSWSENSVLANDFMRFGEGTEVYGSIHSNAGIRFDGVAHNLISSSVATVDDPDHNGAVEFGVHTHVNVPPATGVNDTFRALEAPNNPVPDRSDVFMAGRAFPVVSTDFGGVLGDLSYMKNQAQSGIGNSRYFDDSNLGRRIILKTNDTFDICKVNAYDTTTNIITNYKKTAGNGTCGTCSGQCLSNYAIPDNGVIFVEDNVWLGGQIDGKKVTIVAANLNGGSAPSVFIPNSVLYTHYNGSDIIGIIGQNDVEIPSNSDSTLRIDAALIAQQGRVGRANYGTTDHKTSITVYGALATNYRYGFAWTNGAQDWGYATRNLVYDNNLLYYPPPYFPTGTQYAMDLWEER